MSYPIIGDSTVLHSPPAKNKRGPVAQLGARRVRDAKVVGSNPVASTSKKSYFASKIALFFVLKNRKPRKMRLDAFYFITRAG